MMTQAITDHHPNIAVPTMLQVYPNLSARNTLIRAAYNAVLNLAILTVRRTNKGWTTRVIEWMCLDGSRKRGRSYSRCRDKI